jgi:hypothetical protein
MTDTTDEMVRSLLDHIKAEHAAELALTQRRVAAVLGYLEGIINPTPPAITAVRSILTGQWDNILDSLAQMGEH